MSDLGDFFSLIGEGKKKEEEKKKEILGDVSLDSLFSSLAEERKKIKNLEEEKDKEREKLLKDAKIFESFLFSETKKPVGDPVLKLEKGLQSLEDTSYDSIDTLMKDICREFDITPKKLHNDFKKKHGMIPDKWIKQEEEVVEEVVDQVEEVESKESVVDEALDALKDLIPEEENVPEDSSEEEIRRLKREMDQLRKMVYESVRTATAQGGGGEVRLEFLDDVDRDSAKVNGKVLQYDAVSGLWTGGVGGGGGVTDLGPLTNVAGMASSEIPQGAHLEFNSTSGQFIVTTTAGAATTNIAGYPVTTGDPTEHSILMFDATDEVWAFDTPFNVVDLSDGVEDGEIDYGSFT